ncbi:hypothetical protein [Calidifontibacter indicus]|uniref:hypothetical protein n=1 Tax=Calidifontibacter indicus TaxID=419650 RepID=UPI003D746D20
MTEPRHIITHATTILTRHHVPEVVVALLAVGSIILGADMIVSADQYDRPAFRTALQWAPPGTWGAIIIAVSTAVLATLATARHDLYWPLFGMCGWYGSWAMSSILSAPNNGAVNSASIIYTMLTMLLSALAIIYMREGADTRTTAQHGTEADQ